MEKPVPFLLSSFSYLIVLLIQGCERPPEISGKILVGYSKAGGSLYRISLPSGKVEGEFPLPAPCGDISRGPGGMTYLASGREVLRIPPGGEPVPLFRVEERIDTVLPSKDGRYLYILEHPPPGGGKHGPQGEPRATGDKGGGIHGDGAPEGTAPHRLRLWDLSGGRFLREAELHPLAYEIHEGPGVVVASHILGRRIELVGTGPEGFAGKAEEMEVSDPKAGPMGRQAILRALAIEPGGRWALIVENGLEGEIDRSRLWTLDLLGRRLEPHLISARGIFQDRILFLPSPEGGPCRALLCGRDRILLIDGSPRDGFRERAGAKLPGFFHDPRLALEKGAGGKNKETVLLAGADERRERGLLLAFDPAAARIAWTWKLPGPVDVLEIESGMVY